MSIGSPGRDRSGQMLEGSVGAAPSERRGRPRLWRLGLPVALAVVVTVVAIAVSGAGVSDGPHLSAAAARMQSVLSGIPQHGTMLGSPSARVTVTEFADLQCPYCDAYSLTLFPLLTGYVQSGQVKMVYRTMAFIGRDSVEAGRAAAAAAEQNKLWSFVDAFYYNQGAENSGYVTPKFLRRVGALVPGLDVNKMMTRMRSSATLIELRRMTALAHARNVHATPTFLIDAPGRREERVVGFTTLKRAIQNDLRP